MPEVVFYGETFHVTDDPNGFAFMEFAAAAEEVEVNSTPAMAALYRVLRESIVADPFDDASTDEAEWLRFAGVARRNRANSDTLMPVLIAVYTQASERPTGQPSVSSDGLEPTPLRSVSKPADPAMDRLSGRPDLQLAVMMQRGEAV